MDAPLIQNILENLDDSKVAIRNLTFFMALMYMDHIADHKLIYPTTNRALKIYAGCLTVAARMDPRLKINIEALAKASLSPKTTSTLHLRSNITATS